ncbi:MAG: SemiSWEET transporter [Acidobacteriota bacterium]
MQSNLYDWIGYAAATLTTVSFVPQAVRVIRTRQTGDLSLAMYSIFAVGVAMWLVYGIALGSLPIVLANATTLVLVLIILVMKLRFG